MSNTDSQDSDDELEDCPICVEPFDESDKLFLPCHCNYRVCMFCVRRLMTEFDGRCPGCRAVYNEANFRIKEIDPEEQERRRAKEKQKALERARQQQLKQSSATQSSIPGSGSQLQKNVRPGQQQQQPPMKKPTGERQSSTHLSPLGGPQAGPSGTTTQFTLHDAAQESLLAQQRKNLANVRVVQNHVVFVLGLPLSLAKEDILRRPEHFGQYGPIVKIVVGHPASAPGRAASASAHITFQRTEDAREAIRGVDGVVVDGHQIRASFGTTRYCHAFLRGQHCQNPDCLFLHQEVDAQTMQSNRQQQQQMQQQLSQHPGTSAAASSGANPTQHQSATFGGTDPFALENVPEPLNGIDLVQYEKQRNRVNATPATMGRAPGEGRPLTNPVPPPPPGHAQQQNVNSSNNPTSPAVPVSYDCALSLVADLVMSRSQMPDDLRKKLAWITGPRERSGQFSGLECVLADSVPLFVAPIANETVGGESTGRANTPPSTVGATAPGSSSSAAAAESGKDKKAAGGRKGKKYARGGDAEAY